jgi:TolA-binding protein
MFGAGDLESSSPYGLTPAEKVIIKNKTIVKNNEKKIKKTDTMISELSERIDGLESLLEGEGNKAHKNKLSLINISKNEKIQDQLIISNQKRVDITLAELSKQIEMNNKNILLLKESMDKIVKVVNEINGKYVTKSEFKNLLSLLDNKEKKSTSKSSKQSTLHSKNPKSLMKKARLMFKKDDFTRAIPILKHLISIKHRPAECNYYLGDIHYYRRHYKKALYYFKTSMTLYDKAKYLPKLLLHSAISFDKLNDTENAQNFYNTLVDIYPDTKEAKQAQEKLAKLN